MAHLNKGTMVSVENDELRRVIEVDYELQAKREPSFAVVARDGETTVQQCDVFGEVVATSDDTGSANARVRITRLFKDGEEVDFYPPLRGRIVEIADADGRKASDEASLIANAEGAEKGKLDFFSAQIGQKLVLRPESLSILDHFFEADPVESAASEVVSAKDIVILLVTGVDRRVREEVIEVKLRSIVDPASKENKTQKLKLKTATDKAGLQDSMKFVVRAEHVRKATVDDELKSCTKQGGPTKEDEMAITYPGYFVASTCHYDWVQAKELYKKGDLTFDFGGMNALLEYRDWLSNFILERVRDLARIQAKNDRISKIYDSLLAPEMLPENRDFIDSAANIGWAAPGSTEATSDIDLNTWGDSTEWAATTFNQLFRSLHDDIESGIVFDVNFYAKDYLPRTGDIFKTRGQGEKKFLEPSYDHKLSDSSGENAKKDRENQSIASYLHMRRYMTADEWETYGSMVQAEQYQSFANESETADKCFKENIAELLMLMNRTLRQKKIRTKDGKKVTINPSQQHSDTVAQIQAEIDKINGAVGFTSVQMAAENRLYENKLSEVAQKRLDFANKKFWFEKKKLAIGEVDSSYVELRRTVANAVYFANECYATEGSLAQVVAGKQKLSAGVTMGREGKTVKMHNIRYTPQQMMHSLNEQLGDFFKEASRDYADDFSAGKEANVAFGNAVVASGKYLHRYFNAVKYLYEYSDRRFEEGVTARFDFTDETEGLQLIGNEDFFEALDALEQEAEGLQIPRSWFKEEKRTDDDVRDFRRACGFGLEMLKKFKPDMAQEAYPYSSRGGVQYGKYVDFLAAKLGFERDDLLAGDKLKGKDEIARDVIGKYFGYLDLGDCRALVNGDGGVIDTLPKLKSALLCLHANVTNDYYKELKAGKI